MSVTGTVPPPEAIPIGTASYEATIPDTVTLIELEQPWISFSLINDGPNSVKVAVNNEDELLDNAPVESGEFYNCDMRYPVVDALYLQAESGGTAAVRIKAKVGRPLW